MLRPLCYATPSTHSARPGPGVVDRRIGRLERDPGRERAFWTSPAAKNRHARRDPKTVHNLETPDNIPDDSGDPKAFTWLTTEQFDRMPDGGGTKHTFDWDR